MGEKKENQKGEAEKKKGDGEKKEKTPIAVVLKTDMHCQGCATKIYRFLRRFPGVEAVKVEGSQNKVTVNGIVDPSTVREKLQCRMKRKVDLVSPQPKKGENQEKKNAEKEKKQEAEKKPKETPVTTAVLKLNFHCHGCMEKIQKIVSKTKGVHDSSMDEQKELLTVKGTMDVKSLTENLKEKLKKPVEIVPPKKEKGGGEDGGDGGTSGGKKKNKNKNGGSGDDGGKEGGEMGGNQMEEMGQYGYKSMPVHPEYGHGYWYWPGYPGPVHAPQMFSDENPNACSIL